MKKSFMFIVYLLVLTACSSESSSNDSPDTLVLGSTSLLPLVNSGATIENGVIVGDGSLVAISPLGSISSAHNFSFGASIQQGGHVVLTGYGTNQNLSGVDIKFSNQDGQLKVDLSVGSESIDISSFFASQDPANILYSIDIHNDETPAHIVIWSDLDEQPIFNSEDDMEAPGNGSGTFFGLTLSSAQVSKLDVSEPVFEE